MNIAHWIENWAAATPGKIAIRFEDQDISYARFNEQIKTSARRLKNTLGVKPGDRVAYLGQNHPHMLVLLFACARLGAILVPLNWRLAAQENLYVLQDSAAVALFVDEAWRQQCADLKNELPDCQLVALQGDPGHGCLRLPDLLQ